MFDLSEDAFLAKSSGTEIKRESVVYTTSNARGFALIKMLKIH